MIGNMIKKARTTMGISQKRLSEILNVSQQTVGSWEVNRTEPSSDMLKKIAESLNVSINYLLMSEEEKKEKPTVTDEPKKDNDYMGFAFSLQEGTNLTEEDIEEILNYVDYKIEKRRAKDDNRDA